MKLRITVAIVAMLASVGAASARPVTEEDLLDNYLYDLAFAGLLQNSRTLARPIGGPKSLSRLGDSF